MTIWGVDTFTCPVDRSSGLSSARVPNHDLKKSSTKSGRQRPFLLLERFTSGKHCHSSLSSCCCSLPVPVKSSQPLMPASVTPSPSVSFNTVTVLSSGSGSGYSAPSRPFCFRISTSGEAWAPDHGSTAARRRLQYLMYKFSHLD